ncbi:cell division protein ZapA [Lederbergia panacisoli]|uniref:cell division protein ZapA n=1 Tax=Lederbergia panacisoli TaxID=1255251 RepID=UPI00214C2F2B|nr:cell division protein ZapA [Lederbergia panacisoli]MCR2821937.1 cell division protein ZapA [Lederbergia panacisoli]
MTENEKIRAMVMIYGQQYTISGTETTEHMQQVAAIVDKKMREINSVNPNLNTSSLAVLTAVNTIHEYIKLQEKYEELVEEFKRLKD